MKRVLSRELDYPGPDSRYYFEGIPFTGIAISRYLTGELKSESEFREGVQWGIHRKYSRVGKLTEEGSFRADFREGVWRTWHPNGQLASEEVREFGCPLTRKRWDSIGKLLEEYKLNESDPSFQTLQAYRKIYGTSGYIPSPESAKE